MTFQRHLAAFALIAVLPLAARAENPPAAATTSAAEARLREALRSTTLQLRAAQGDLAVAQGKLDEKEKEAAALKKKYDALVAKNAEDIALGSKHIAALNEKVAGRDARIRSLDESLDKWKAEAIRVTEIARTTEAERARLKILSDRMTLRVADREAKNIGLVKLGNTILDRYEKFALGEAVANREPFIGLARVDLQTFVQDYADKIADLKAKPGTPSPEELAAEPAASAATPSK